MIPHALADAAADALGKVPGWAWAAVALFGAWCGRAYSTYQERAALRREVEAVCETCKKPERSCKCPDKEHGNGTSRSLRLDVQETLAGVKAVAETVGRVDTRLLTLEGVVNGLGGRVGRLEQERPQDILRLASQIADAKAELGRAPDPLGHLVEPEQPRKERA